MLEKNNNYAFIDSQNLNLGLRDSGWKIDWRKFRQYLKNKYLVVKAYIFIGYIKSNTSLYENLREYGFIIVFKKALEFKKDKKTVIKGNVDAELVLNTMIELNNFDQAIIVSGDGDFFCLIEYLDKKRKFGKLLVPTKKFSRLLREFTKNNKVVRIDLLRNSLEYKKKTGICVRSKP